MVKVQERLGRTPRRPARRRGETDSRTVVIIVLSVLGGLMLLGCLCLIPALLLPAVQQAREAARRTQSRNNLHQIGLALHNYHDVYGQFPPGGVFAEGGTPHHGWQYSILPYMDEAYLYNQIDTNRSWNDPVNDAHFCTVVPTYLNPSEVETLVQGYGASHYAANQNALRANGNISLHLITDGASNTILVGEVASGFKPWGDPTNVRDPAAGIGRGPNQFGRSTGPGGAQILFGDGSARFISDAINPATLRALSTPDGGEQVGAF